MARGAVNDNCKVFGWSGAPRGRITLQRQKIADRRRQFGERTDDPIRLQARDRDVGVAEVHRDHRDRGRAGGVNVGFGIADHDRPAGLAAGAPNGLPKNFRVGLLHAERILSADRGKALRQLERLQQPDRQPFELVGADRKPMAGAR